MIRIVITDDFVPLDSAQTAFVVSAVLLASAIVGFVAGRTTAPKCWEPLAEDVTYYQGATK